MQLRGLRDHGSRVASGRSVGVLNAFERFVSDVSPELQALGQKLFPDAEL